MSESRMKPQALETSGLSLEDLEHWGNDLIEMQTFINWGIGDLALAAKALLGEDNYSQVFPPNTSPGLIQRCEAVSRAYAVNDRNPLATWTQHMGVANKPNRIELVSGMVDRGETSDESRKADKEEREARAVATSHDGSGQPIADTILVTTRHRDGKFFTDYSDNIKGWRWGEYDIDLDIISYRIEPQPPDESDQEERADQVQVIKDGKAQWVDQDEKPRWCLAVDTNYFLHRFWYSGAGIRSAVEVTSWLDRTISRLKEKGLTDVICCFDSKINNRKELTKDWDDKYKDRPPKDQELSDQLDLVHELLEKAGLACVQIEGFEGDDIMASMAKQFPGRVTILSQDKDLRQCLSPTCNMLLDVEWETDDHSGDHKAVYKWLSAKQHTEATQIPPAQWPDYQCLMGDATDGISGAVGIGEKGGADLIKEFKTCEAAIAAAKADEKDFENAKAVLIEAGKKEKPAIAAAEKQTDSTMRRKARLALIAFEEKLEVTRQLVTLVDSLELKVNTRL